jgi:Ras GTPase-activating protein 3
VSSRSAQYTAKEEFMGDLYRRFCTDKHVGAVKQFLDAISTIIDDREVEVIPHEAILLKDG